MRSPSRRRARGTGSIDGLKIQLIDDPAASVVDLDQALRMLARMMVRGHQHAGDHTAISPVSRSSSALTAAAHTSPDHVDDAA